MAVHDARALAVRVRLERCLERLLIDLEPVAVDADPTSSGAVATQNVTGSWKRLQGESAVRQRTAK
jgi:hypothetical protein